VESHAVTMFISIEFTGVQREVTFATHTNTTRLFTIGAFLDTEHYSYLEALLLQNNPKEDQAVFEVHASIPAIKGERKKVL
jgi:hypothetical protein